MTTQAKQWVATSFGGPEGIEFREHEVPAPGPGEVAIDVRAIGVNPIDVKILSRLDDPALLPFPLGNELSGVVAALGPDTQLASGGGAVGDEVLAFRVQGAYATRVNVPAVDVFAKPADVPFDEAAGLLLVGTTASDALHTLDVRSGETILLHGASGAVGASVLQQAKLLGVRVIGTTSERGAETVRRFGGVPVAYGPGLAERVREAAPEGIAAAIDAVGTDEALEVSRELVSTPGRVLTIVRHDLAGQDGLVAIGGANPASAAYRDRVRPELIALAAKRELVVPIARTFPLADAREALDLVASGHAGGKLVLHP
ncbi:NADP-dependent oxidoreductase [Pseudoclavibacter chungangensis]|uniref:NADP-dependent oxidoreductase n=1 Tax=Pseudoclavibacter chungangensis TaxID=587635 RepID=A0A7J5C1T4_9MICO|nr:NADP-dependent oxidoreductase [Pseudoclavibacter chungangensis]KAB1662581.1 NADP-dependent oxidoreductase [Pseudoclavibacter chungangensis]NYJ68629.1 NADPH:quinone reductase-like Zn-dependent oxidoreductase [Pseudoclavibacter chungangensis]